MDIRTRWERAPYVWRTVLVLALMLALGVGSASAKKPVKPPPPDPDPTPAATGTLVCSGTDGLFTMTPAGDDQRELDLVSTCTDDPENTAGRGPVSRERHNGKLWQIQKCATVGDHPDGADHKELFVIAEGDSIGLQLTDDASMEFSYYNASLAWGPGDEFVSWVGHTWAKDAVTGEDYVYASGIYAAPLLYDANGDIVGLSDDPVLVVEIDTWTFENGIVVVSARNGHDWSPDGTQVVWHHTDNELYITDVDDPTTHTLLTSTASGWTGWWSSQDEIVFSTGLLIKRIDADGTDETTIVTARRRTNVLNPKWSPDGEMIAYHVYDSKGTKKIYVTPVDSPRPSSTGVEGGVGRWLDE